MDWRFDEATLDRLAEAGVAAAMVLRVMTAGPPRLLRDTEVGRQVAAPVSGGRWLSVSLIEQGDDQWLVDDARWMDDDESKAMTDLMERRWPSGNS